MPRSQKIAGDLKMTGSTEAPVITLRDSISKFGSADSLNWRVLALFAVPAFSSTLFFEMDRLGGSPFGWFWLTFGAYAVTVITLWVLSETTNQRSWQKSRPLTVLFILIVAGMARGSFMYFVGMQTGLVPADDFWYRMISAPMFITFSVFFFATPVTAHLEHRRMLAQLARERGELDRLQTSLASQVRSRRLELTSQARQLLEPAIWELRKHLADAVTRGSVQQAVSEISRITDSMVRPISHRFAKEEQYGVSSTTEQPIIKTETDAWPRRVTLGTMLPVFFIFTAGIILGGPSFVLVDGPARGLPAAVGLSLIFSIGVWVMSRVLRGVVMATIPAFILLSALLALIGAGFYPLNSIFQLSSSFGIQAMVFMSQVGGLIFIFQLIQLRRKLLVERLAAVNETLDGLNTRLRQELWLTQRDIGLLLHGPVQGSFYAAAMKLSNTSRVDEALIEEIRQDIGAALLKLNSNPALQVTKLETQLESITEAWGESLDIKFAAPEGLLAQLGEDPVGTRVLIEVIREAITNAVKHGAATKIAIELAQTETGARLTIQNDGLPPNPATKGLGTEMFDEVSSAWTLEPAPAGARLELEIALAQRPAESAAETSAEVGGSQPARSQTSAAATAANSAPE
jgi:hypothetical protein